MADTTGTEVAPAAEPVEEASALAEDSPPDASPGEGSPPDTASDEGSPPDTAPEPAHEDAAPTEALEVPNGEQPTDTEAATPTEALKIPNGDEATDAEAATPTDVLATQAPPQPTEPERLFTAPSGFDAGSTVKIDAAPEPATEVLAGSPSAPTEPVVQRYPPPKTATPRSIPPRTPARRAHSWGWVLALILVIAALTAVTIFSAVWLTRPAPVKQSQEDLIRTAIQNFDTALQKGDLATLRSITCGSARDAYVNYDERAWADTHARVTAAKQYPVVASIDQVAVNDGHAEANVTTFMAYDPQVRSARSFDLQFRDDQWKICQAPNN